jgi:hypothetical protein
VSSEGVMLSLNTQVNLLKSFMVFEP